MPSLNKNKIKKPPSVHHSGSGTRCDCTGQRNQSIVHSRASSSVKPVMETCGVWMLNGKRPLGSEARQIFQWQKRSHSLDVSSFMFFFSSPSTQKQEGWRSIAVRSSSALWYKFLRVLIHSCVTGRLYCIQKQMSRVKGHSEGGWVKGSLHILWAGSGSL